MFKTSSDKTPVEPVGLWPKRYKAMTIVELASELARLAATEPLHDYGKRRHFILQELDQRTARTDA